MWILFLLSLTLAHPQYPRFPDTFTQTFTETFSYPFLGDHSTNGTYYYDWATQRFRLDRQNGRFDRYCGINGLKMLQNTPCSHIVVNGDRYLYYPELNECCYCCSAEHGCGMLKPAWMEGAEYLGIEEFKVQKAHKWDKPGLQHNIVYESLEEEPIDRTLMAIYQAPTDMMEFKNDRKMRVDYDMLELPSICQKNKSCNIVSVCTAIRKL
jgi:hypothetical protein